MPSSPEPFEPPLYRYMPLNSEKRIGYAEDLLRRNRIYYAPMSSFNDPFEGRVNLSTKAAHETKIAHVAKIIQRQTQVSFEDAKAQAPRWIEFNEERGIERTRNMIQNEWGYWCLCQSEDDIVMWSIYADGHKGICVEFTARSLEHVDFFAPIQVVDYPDQMPPVNLYTTSREEIARAAILSKSKRWKREGERRAIVTDISETNPRERDLPAGIISTVYLGTRIEKNNRRLVLDWVRESESPIAVMQARLDEREYGLVFDVVRTCCAK